MRWRHSLVAAGAALALAAVAATPAQATAQTTAQTRIPVRVTGALSVQFHGDPATGCAHRGLCGDNGTVTWHPSTRDEIVVVQSSAPHAEAFALLIPSFDGTGTFSDGETTATAARAAAGPGAPVTRCVDATNPEQGLQLGMHRGRVTVSMSAAGQKAGVLATRCAGPRDADVLPHLPAPTLALAALVRGHAKISLTAVHSFHTHGLSGSITSTIVVHVGQPGRPQTERGGSLGGLGRMIEVDYRATLTGSVVEQVRGATNPLECAPLGSCGLAGTITLTPRVRATRARLLILGTRRTPRRDLLALAGIGRGAPAPGGASGFGAVQWRGSGSVQSDLTQDGVTCRDVVSLDRGGLAVQTSRRRWRVSLGAGDGLAAQDLVTRCPGPLSSGTLATATAPISTLGRRTTRIALAAGHTIADDGYRVRVVPHLTLTLTRLRVRTITTLSPGGGSFVTVVSSGTVVTSRRAGF